MNKNSLLTQYSKSGGKGKEKLLDKTKIGRPKLDTCAEYKDAIIEEIDYLRDLKISQMAYKILHYNTNNINREDVLNIYKNLLYEKGFMTIGNKVHQNELYYEFTRFYGVNLLNLLESDIDFHDDYNWLRVITRKSTRTSHPLRHLLLINFLVGDIDMFFSK